MAQSQFYGYIIILGVAALQKGEFRCGYELACQALQLMVEVGDNLSIAGGLNRFSWFAVRQQDWERAVRLLAASEQLLNAIGGFSLPILNLYRCKVAEARGLLDEISFQNAWMEGWRMSESEAVGYALLEA